MSDIIGKYRLIDNTTMSAHDMIFDTLQEAEEMQRLCEEKDIERNIELGWHPVSNVYHICQIVKSNYNFEECINDGANSYPQP